MSDASFIISEAISAARRNKVAGPMIREVMARSDEFAAKNVRPGADLMLTACGLIPEARKIISDEIDRRWFDNYTSTYGSNFNEVIIGSGPSAAIYAATRVGMGFGKPVVIEQNDTVGGSFALTKSPSFYLNSSNRPGLLGQPGKGEALNYLPGCPVQPSDISSLEYQPNTDLAYCVRVALARNANVLASTRVESVDPYAGILTVSTGPSYRRSKTITYGRLIDATGISRERNDFPTSDRIITTSQFLRRFDSPWPLRDLKRVAVIGGGDSGRIVVEALLGIGPSGMSLASLDYVESIDWYGRSLPNTCDQWKRQERTRYLRIGKYIGSRVRVINRRGYAVPAMGSALVNDRAYDLVIVCTGFKPTNLLDDYSFYGYSIDGTGSNVARACSDYSQSIFRIGPAAQLPFTDQEYDDNISARSQNMVALFRYANKTSALAMSLPRAEAR